MLVIHSLSVGAERPPLTVLSWFRDRFASEKRAKVRTKPSRADWPYSYNHLAIHEGGTASLEFLRVHFADIPDTQHHQVRRELEKYCGQDMGADLDRGRPLP